MLNFPKYFTLIILTVLCFIISAQVSNSLRRLSNNEETYDFVLFLINYTFIFFSFCVFIIFAIICLNTIITLYNYYQIPYGERADWRKNNIHPLLKNELFWILLLSLYLSLAAVAAIPSLQETSSIPEKFSSNNLQIEINKSMDHSIFELDANNDLIANPFDDIDDNTQDNSSNENINQGNQMILEISSRLQRMSKISVIEYENSLTKTGNRETINHFHSIIKQFNENIIFYEGEIKKCLKSIKSGIASKNPVGESCQYKEQPKGEEIPSREQLGRSLGHFFQYFFGWLLISESLPLAMIVGLIGFGLLGSICSTFVRERIHKNQTQDFKVEDLPKVIIIGLSAAILAFLSVMGGFPILFTETSEPNPYSLLLICFIAAVFGEDVWRKAQDRINDK